MAKELRNKRKISIVQIIIFCLITTIISIDLTLANYKTEVELQTATTVALMASDTIIEIENNLDGYPGCEPIVCPINLTNAKNNTVCEVSQSYSIYVDRTDFENIPIEISLYKDKYCTEILALDENGKYSSDEFIFEAGIESSVTYYLKIEWPEEANNSDFAFEIEYFKLNIDIEQID